MEPKTRSVHNEPLNSLTPAKILDIPNELMCFILSDVDEEDIINLGCLSRRLNEVAFGFYFTRLAPKPEKGALMALPRSITIGSTHDERWSFRTFDAFRLALFAKPQITSLHTSFSESSFTKEVAQTSRFFRTCPELLFVTFTFPCLLVNDMTPAYRKALYDLLDSITYTGRNSSGSGSVDFRCPMLMLKPDIGTLASEPSGILPYDGTLLTTPASIVFSETAFLFERHFLDWTIKSLNACHLTTVRFQDVDIGPHLGLLQLDSLTYIVLNSSSVTQVQCNAFLSRHPALLSIDVEEIAPLVDDDDIAMAREAVTPDSLPNTQCISMSGDHLASWLSEPSTLPLLKRIHVHDIPSHATLQVVLHQLAKRGTVHSLSVPLYKFSQTSEWLDIPLVERAEPKMESVTYISMILLGGEQDDGEQDDGAMTERLVGAIALFPCVERVSMSMSFDKGRWAPFRKLLKARCPKMKSVVMGLDTFPCE